MGSFLIITKRMGIRAKLKKFSCGHSNHRNPTRARYGDVIRLLMTEGGISDFAAFGSPRAGLPTECQLQPINTAELEEINSPHRAMCH